MPSIRQRQRVLLERLHLIPLTRRNLAGIHLSTHTQANGVAEKKNRHILEVAREMMNEKDLPKSYWVEVTNTNVFVMNNCTTSGIHDITPHKKFYGKKSDLSHVRIFDSITFVHIPDEKRKKLDPTYSLVSEYGGLDVPIMRTPGAKKAFTTASEQLRRSTREKNVVSRIGYND